LAGSKKTAKSDEKVVKKMSKFNQKIIAQSSGNSMITMQGHNQESFLNVSFYSQQWMDSRQV